MIRLTVILFSLLCLADANANDNWKSNRLIPLQKVTVGPWDNFEATISADDQQLYFTRDWNQIPNIYQQNLPTIETQPFLEQGGDTKQPVLSPDQTHLAYLFYGHDAQGDICVSKMDNPTIDCLTDSQHAEQTPFWLDNQTVGYLRRNVKGMGQQLVAHSLTDNSTTVLYEGNISSPSVTPDGRYIVLNYSESSEDWVVLVAFDRQRNALIRPATFDLPGITGTHAISRSGNELYFSHYLNDTNGDQRVDGNDHAVMFRLPISKWLNSTQKLLPEQLTPVDQNCKFPTLSDKFLYVTCAFEGSLDIYRLPSSGVVPQGWEQAKIDEAYQTARTVEERLLLLNTQRYRQKQQSDGALLERLLNNHLQIGEITAAQFYIQQLQTLYGERRPQQVQLYGLLSELLQVRASKQRVPVGMVTARFTRLVEQTRNKITAKGYSERLVSYANAYLDYELEKSERAITSLQAIAFDADMMPLERFLIFDLLTSLLHQQPEQLLAYYPSMFGAEEFDSESRLHYAFNYLRLLETVQTALQQRDRSVATLLEQPLAEEVAALFQGERIILKLIAEDDLKAQNSTFKALSKLLKQHQKDHHLRKAQHIRAITQLGKAELFNFMELLSRNWLLTTHISEMEFVNTAEQYSVITLDKAYGMLADGEPAKAYNTFYSAIRQTNDMEAHYQFVTLGLSPGLDKQANMEAAYLQFEKQNLIGQNRHYVAALRKVLDAEQQSDQAEKLWQQALAELNQIQFGGINPAMKDLLMGYIYHQQLQRSRKGYQYDQLAYQKAHYHYMMVLDLGRDNSRVRASVWQNLAWLQFDVGQYAYSADLFSQRMSLPFPSQQDEINSRWGYAKALFYANRTEAAYQQGEQLLQLARQLETLPIAPFIEKTAFYAVQAEQYVIANNLYAELLQNANELKGHNRIKALLNYGYSLMKAGDNGLSKQQFEEVLRMADQLQVLAVNEHRLLPLNPQRQLLLAHGFLAELAQRPEQRIEHIQARITTLQKIGDNPQAFGYSGAVKYSLLAKEYLKLAISYEGINDLANLRDAAEAALQSALFWVEESSDESGPVIYHALTNLLSLAISHPQTFSDSSHKTLQQQVPRTIDGLQTLPLRSITILGQQAKLKMLWQRYQLDISNTAKSEAEISLPQQLTDDELRQIKQDDNELYQALSQLAVGLSIHHTP